MKRYAFTMIELIFVIVVLGILAAVAIPKMGGTMVSAQIASAKGDVSAIRASIASARQKMLVRGKNKYVTALDSGVASNTVGVKIFDQNGTDAEVTAKKAIKILTYPVYTKNNGWMKTGTNAYTFSIDGTPVPFTYDKDRGLFDCVRGTSNEKQKKCSKITQ